ncbi:MAG: hypothetical protein PHF00_01640 [Elusimicrobia bacterium]|nr:hypothetical protein [Elusimicrobiota bacterium]
MTRPKRRASRPAWAWAICRPCSKRSFCHAAETAPKASSKARARAAGSFWACASARSSLARSAALRALAPGR